MRATTVEMPEPPGPREGIASPDPSTRPFTRRAEPVRLLVAGDSSAAGVGTRSQDEALAMPLARGLAARLGVPVRWQLRAQSGLTSEGVLHLLMHGHARPADVALVVVGVNDITREVPLQTALRRRAEIVHWLHRNLGVRHVLFPALPEIERFPAVPQPLGWYAGQHARANNRAQAAWARRWSGPTRVTHVPVDGLAHPAEMAEDGFHPGPALYARVGRVLVDACASALAPDPVPGRAHGADGAAGLANAADLLPPGQSSSASAA